MCFYFHIGGPVLNYCVVFATQLRTKKKQCQQENKTIYLKTTNSSNKHDWVTEIFYKRLNHQEQSVGTGQAAEVITALIVDNDFLPVPLLQHFLPSLGQTESYH